MEDPFFQITREDPVSLDSFFSTDLGLGQESGSATTPKGVDGIPADSAEMKPDQAQAIEQIQNTQEPVLPLEKATTLEERIKAIEKEYNDSHLSLVGSPVCKRLLTIARKLHDKELFVQAATICDILQQDR